MTAVADSNQGYLFVDVDGAGRRMPLDPAHVDRQMADLRAAGHRPYLMTEDEVIDIGAALQRLRRNAQSKEGGS